MFTRGNKTNRAHVNKKGIYLKERRDDTISFIVIAIVSHALPRTNVHWLNPCIKAPVYRELRDFYIQHTTKYYNKYVLNDHTELSYLSGSISSKNLSPSLPSIYNNREHFTLSKSVIIQSRSTKTFSGAFS